MGGSIGTTKILRGESGRKESQNVERCSDLDMIVAYLAAIDLDFYSLPVKL